MEIIHIQPRHSLSVHPHSLDINPHNLYNNTTIAPQVLVPNVSSFSNSLPSFNNPAHFIPSTPRNSIPTLVGMPERVVTGTRGATTVRNMPWLMAPVTPSASTRQKTTRKLIAETGHPIFEQCCNFISDEFWKSILLESAKGKLPRGFTFSKSVLSFKKRTKTDMVEIPSDIHSATCVIIDFFRNKGGIRSPLDLEREKKEQEELLLIKAGQALANWSSITSKILKKAYISEYISKMCNLYKLNDEEKKKFKTLINSGFLLGHLSKSNIIFNGYEIVEIVGLKYDDSNKGKKEFKLTASSTIKGKKTSIKRKRGITTLEDLDVKNKCNSKTLNFAKTWGNYVDNFDNTKVEFVVPQTPGVTAREVPGVIDQKIEGDEDQNDADGDDDDSVQGEEDSLFSSTKNSNVLQVDQTNIQPIQSTYHNQPTALSTISVPMSSFCYARMIIKVE